MPGCCVISTRTGCSSSAALRAADPVHHRADRPGRARREDCFSEVTLRIWEKADRFAPQRGSWKAWLTAVTRNTAYNFARQTARRGEVELPEHAPSPAPDPEEALLWAERRRALQRALA